MASLYSLYDIDTDNLIYKKATASQIATTCNVVPSTTHQAVRHGKLIKGRYKVTKLKETTDRRFNLVDITKDEVIGEDLTAKEIGEILKINYSGIYGYCDMGSVIKEKYKVYKTYEFVGEETVKPETTEDVERPSKTDREFTERWDKACDRFKNVKWVKKGGRRLKL